MRTWMKAIIATTAMSTVVMAPLAHAAESSFSRPWWDPTAVIENPVNPDHSEGVIENVQFTDGDGVGKTVRPGAWAKVLAEGADFTPGLYYTVRLVLQQAGTGSDWGVYTWRTYQATDEGKLHIDLDTKIPNRAQSGERVLAAVRVYSGDDMGRDGRPNKVDEKCVLQCATVPPLAATTDVNNDSAIITIR